MQNSSNRLKGVFLNPTRFYSASILFAGVIVLANFTVQYPINDYITYGAIAYPFSFLLVDVLSEKYSKAEVLKVVRTGILLAFTPSLFAADWRIACASVSAFFVAQQLDVYIFYYLKGRFPALWWLRNNGSTMVSQLMDTMIFFHVAFLWTMPWESVLLMALGDYSIKIILALLDTPFFYVLAIRTQKRLGIGR